MPKKKQKYQNRMYVYFDENASNYMTAYSDPSEITAVYNENETEVGIYQFVKTAKVRTKIEVI